MESSVITLNVREIFKVTDGRTVFVVDRPAQTLKFPIIGAKLQVEGEAVIDLSKIYQEIAKSPKVTDKILLSVSDPAPDIDVHKSKVSILIS